MVMTFIALASLRLLQRSIDFFEEIAQQLISILELVRRASIHRATVSMIIRQPLPRELEFSWPLDGMALS
jgi:hypothetical protein